ncbi:GFA family protein [Anaeromyxobacter sp. Fw109-5]|uniref:GFA family protein n=1 Tax=Anaeromyxobacter sp. (strain Fw109-5) TaxID=404589 RepID=UPI0000ED80E1|nr:GFA family protein [Anaeromyxobacter sp. Fw109-5]ABS27021.1 glutathione-dependent formaldehyde-activating GFA [Anaeromyxobacter sp. Fw109-5]
MLTATCHCGAVRVELPRRPRSLTSCNCSICRRYGTLWAYYKPSSIRVVCAAGATSSYSWGHRTIRFVRCDTCGCVTHYERDGSPERSVGVNARNVDPAELGSVRVRRLDGAATWKYLD